MRLKNITIIREHNPIARVLNYLVKPTFDGRVDIYSTQGVDYKQGDVIIWL